MIKRAFAKVNLALNIKNRLSDGYHNLEMINVKTSLFDTLFVSFDKRGNAINIRSNKIIPCDKNNLVYKVIQAFKIKYNKEFTCNVFIKKRIPIQAGLAGGSADAACILKMLFKHFKMNENEAEMISILLPITSDGPYMLYDGLAKVLGKGELIKPINAKIKGKMILIKPLNGCNTSEIFSIYDESYNNEIVDIKKVETALVKHDFNLLKSNVGNSLSDAIILLNNDIKYIINRLKALGFDIVNITGSGSTCFAISKNKKLYRKAKHVFNKKDYDLVKIVNFQ